MNLEQRLPDGQTQPQQSQPHGEGVENGSSGWRRNLSRAKLIAARMERRLPRPGLSNGSTYVLIRTLEENSSR
ncbi:MAG: hypothetical protein IPF71_09325 [Rhodoferax sp.]|nr:hypothetical protein [Rhodoferax sp.]